jgi:hypothetical protein
MVTNQRLWTLQQDKESALRAPVTGAVIVATSSASAGKRHQASPNVRSPQNNRKERTLSTPSASDAVVKDTISKIVERVVFSGEEAEDSKDIKQYSSVKKREEKDGLSEMGSVLPRNVVSCKSILLSTSKSLPQRKQSPEGGSSKKAGTLPGVG